MKIGDIIAVKFLDHVQFTGATATPIEIEVVGRLTAVTKHALEIQSWITADPDLANNNEGFVVLRKTILGKVRRVGK